MIDIKDKTESEVYELIFWNTPNAIHVSMPLWVAEQIIYMKHLESTRLRDWAWETIVMELNE